MTFTDNFPNQTFPVDANIIVLFSSEIKTETVHVNCGDDKNKVIILMSLVFYTEILLVDDKNGPLFIQLCVCNKFDNPSIDFIFAS